MHTYTQAFCANSTPLHVITITNEKYAGDRDQINGVVHALYQSKDKVSIQETKLDAETYESNFPQLDGHTKTIIISSNNYGVEALQKLCDKGQKFTGVITSHQYVSSFDDLTNTNAVSIIALPKHIVTPEIADKLRNVGIQLLQTNGVSQNLLPDICDKAYKNEKKKILGDETSKYMLVILGGDAQNPDGKTWTYYKKEEAINLAKHVAKMASAQNFSVLITNAPRTGKFDPQTGIETGAHKDGKIDEVTIAFIEALKQNGVMEDQFKLYDFQFGQPSMFPALIGALRAQSGSIALIEGSSTSMISQSIANLKGFSQVIAYTHGAMTEVHHKHLACEQESGRISILENGEVKSATPVHTNREITTAEQTIAKAILEKI